MPIVAWRAWRPTHSGLLAGVVTCVVWPSDDAMLGECRKNHAVAYYEQPGGPGVSAPAHRAPHEGCQCGVYGHASLADLEAEPWMRDAIVVGRAKLWGRVVDHERGWRAERGRVTALVDHPAADRESTVDAARRYGVPVVAMSEASVWAGRWLL